MDGFDDLLNPSRAALEQNPFADNPFAQRSSSPDPWASPFGATDAADAFGSSASHFASTDGFGSHSDAFESSHPYEPEPYAEPQPTTSDPLDSALYSAKDDDEDQILEATATSPGFRESVAAPTPTTTTVFSQQDPTIAAPSLEEFDKLIPTKFKESSTAESPTTTTFQPYPKDSPPKVPASFTREPQSRHNSIPSTASGFKSPLDPASPTVLERSIAGLALGGESPGGWQTETRTPWSSDAPPTFAPKPSFNEDEDDSDDDKPILQALQHKQLHQQEREAAVTLKKDDQSLQPVFVISVDDPQKVGDPIRSFTMYTVHTRTTSPEFQKSTFSVLRRFSDFLWLYETLSANNPGVVVPPVPEKNALGRFDDSFVKQRRLGLEKCIQKIANHPVLMKDSDLRFFLESDSFALDIKHRKAELAHERGGLIASIGQSIVGPRFYETDEWFDKQKVYLDSLESQLRGLVRAIEIVAKHRQELSVVAGEFAQNVNELASSEVGQQLAQSLSGLAEVEQKGQDIQAIQADQDVGTIMATADEYARLINSVRLAFASRIRVYHSWKASEADLLRTKQTHERHRAQGRIPPDRLGYSLSQVAESERRAAESKLEYELVSKLVKSEVARFEQERIQDFKEALEAFLEGMISRQKELISTWENYQQMLLKKVGSETTSGSAVEST
ncbi:Vps5 C terminal like-domain-containing protein [Crepidotus variabilis]|uniref:Vps5 C terminal like-domain-containing protein n=1 Tax=Crepidotus variabilis TaxID=179855 RepID=A0A9P6EJV3_9AGAR|nr:Vps5 C terminal like-domain-containing protein [Crepidotus variabilis]